jgi:hypothetical protein
MKLPAASGEVSYRRYLVHEDLVYEGEFCKEII